MLLLEKLFKRMQGLNKEYLLLFAVLSVLGFLIYSSTAVSQAADPKEIILATIYPIPLGNFDTLRFRDFIDIDDLEDGVDDGLRIDPAGMSKVTSLNIENRLKTGYISGPSDTYTVDFTSGDATLNIVYATRFYQDDPGPPGPAVTDGTNEDTVRSVGKYVYDIAEGVYAEDCEAGDVVLISDNDKTDVMKSSGSFANRVAGVISGNPKIYMGSNKHKVPLALAGIVKCKASAENGKIKSGDLLVTASLPGHAMKAMPHEVNPGMVIGKAMEPLNEGIGKILILVNKQ